MLSAVVSVLLVGLLALGPVLWRVWRDRREERALAVRAEVEAAVRRALDGESLVSVQVEAPKALRGGRVILSVPGGWDWLIRDAWSRVIDHIPPDYELVVRPGERQPVPVVESGPALPRAA
jgi:hypothetical protein